jgi:ABC-2 type transport system permease protein
VKVYLAIAAKSFQRSLAYRAANVAGIITNTFFAAVYVYVYIALFRGRGEVGGLSVQDTITYTVVSQSLLMTMSAFGNLELSEAIVKGDIATDLSRPVDFYLFWAAIDLGRAVYFMLFRGLPTFAIGCLLFGASLPPASNAWLLFPVAVVLGMAVSFAFRFITASLAFWLVDVRGIHYLTNTVVLFLSGFAVPLNFFPGAMRTFAEALPFASLAHLPISIYLGKVDNLLVIGELARGLAWLLALVLFGRFLLDRMVRRLVVNGG